MLKMYLCKIYSIVNWVFIDYWLSKSGDHSLFECGAMKTLHLLYKYLEVSSRSVEHAI